ncbi:MAG TPA: sensor histidine kinase, partial [Gaiellaceae bacterium]|nr:sensor histidine kinase [Gaiellaceae bacterium]
EAGSRALRARLAPTGTPRASSPTPDSTKGRRLTSRRSATARPTHPQPDKLATNGAAPNGHAPAAPLSTPAAPLSTPTPPLSTPTAPLSTPSDAPVVAEAMPSQGLAPAAQLAALDDPLAALVSEAQASVSGSANTLRDVRERYRTAYLEKVERWEALRTLASTGNAGSASDTDEALAGREVGVERSVLDRIDLAAKSLENAWLFLAREDASLVSDPSGPPSAADAQMRIVEAQEQERSRLAREVHDGPAQALSNAIFQVEVVQRLLDRDERLARAELRQLREVLTRELRGVRAYLSQLRPPLLADLGLSGAIQEAGDQIATALGVPVSVELEGGVDNLPETVEVVALRVIQEALQNARKHAQPTSIRVRMAREGASWIVEVRDDGKGFDSGDTSLNAPRNGRRSFGLQFMRERAELIGARFEVRSSPNLGTAVRMTIPPGAMGMPIPGEDSR